MCFLQVSLCFLVLSCANPSSAGCQPKRISSVTVLSLIDVLIKTDLGLADQLHPCLVTFDHVRLYTYGEGKLLAMERAYA